jgi:hypothetical protein
VASSQSAPSRAVPVALFCACAAAAFLLRARGEELRPPPEQTVFDIPAFPAEVLRPFSFGLRSLVADLTFLEAIQIHGGMRRPRSADEGAPLDRALNRLLTYSTDLDPKFAGAYRFAGNAMPRHTSDGKVTNVLQAEVILAKGARERGDDWRIPFELGFIQSYYLGHFADAAHSLAMAGRIPGAPEYLPLLATRTAAEAGDLDFAEQMAVLMSEQASEESTQQEWQKRLLDLRMERHLRAIEAAVKRYRERTGRTPASVEALVTSGDLPAFPHEPHGGRYRLDANGEPRSTAAARLRITGRRGTMSGLEVR